MQIFVKTFVGKVLTFEFDGSESIGQIKQMIYELEGHPPVDQQRLIYNAKDLEDEKTLADYNVERETTLHLRGKPKPTSVE